MTTPNLDVKVFVQIGDGDTVPIGTVRVPVSAVSKSDNYGPKNGLHVDLGYFIKNLQAQFSYGDVTDDDGADG